MSGDRWLYGWSLGYAAVGAASLLVPLYAIELGAGALLVGLLAATAAFAGVPGAIIWGRLASSSGRRRPFVLAALGATAGVLALMPLLGSAWLVLGLNAALWFVVAAAAPVLSLIMVDGVHQDDWDRQFAKLNSYQGYGWLGGLLAGAAWNAVAVRYVSEVAAVRLFFLVAAAGALVGGLVVRVWYPPKSTLSERQFERVFRRITRGGWGAGRYVRSVPFGPGRLYWALRTVRLKTVRRRFGRRLTTYLLAVMLFFLGFSVFFGPLPAYLTGVGYGTDAIFALFVVSSAGSAVSYGRVGELLTTRDPGELQREALVLRAAAFPLVVVLGSALPATFGLPVVAVVFGVIGAAWAVVAVTATSLVTRLAPASTRGEALGAYTALGGLGGGVGSALGGVVAAEAGYLVTFGVAGLLVLTSVGVLLRIDGSAAVAG
jgi:MFS family permease